MQLVFILEIHICLFKMDVNMQGYDKCDNALCKSRYQPFPADLQNIMMLKIRAPTTLKVQN